MKREVKKGLELLGLDEKEYKIIEALKTGGALRPVDIARKTEVGRTTVNFLLKKLQLRGILVHDKIKNHYEWRINDENQIKNRLEELFRFFNAAPEQGLINIPENVSVEVLKGRNYIWEISKKLVNLGKNKRVYFIQGNKSIIHAVKDFPLSDIDHIQSSYRKNKIILDGIGGESVLELIKNLPLKHLKLYEDRMTVVYLVNDSFVDFDMDIIVVENMAIFVNYGKNLVITIRNEEMCKVLISMMEAMKAVSRKIDFNKFIRELIESKK